MKIFGSHDSRTLDQIAAVGETAVHAALMADGHLGYHMPIGGVAAYRNQVSPVGVGFDIACGNCAIRTDLTLHDFAAADFAHIADEIAGTLAFGVGGENRHREAPRDHELFEAPEWDVLPVGATERNRLRNLARRQLGTIGSGNHYVDVFADRQDRIWVGVHFGSRGLGHTIASGFLNLVTGRPWGAPNPPETPALLDLGSEMGRDYWALMSLAGRYAYAGREWAARQVVEILGGREEDMVHNHHNFAWKETHFGEEVVVVRKGATPAFPGQRGFVGGSMGDDAVILEGAPHHPDQEAALFSTVHGAGRVMSRREAAGKRKWGTNKVIRPGKVSPEMMQGWIEEKGVILRGGGLDESPHAYRRLPEVLEAQGGTIRILEVLRPLVVVMAE
jgi:tRNA-splicing ligase RtcB (3'-phosphate/5'-hydroxy nucleic acid ligase)